MTLRTKIVGRRGPALGPWEVECDFRSGPLRDLIAALVRREVAAFVERQEERKLARVLTAPQIAEAAGTGAIRMGGELPPQPVDPDAAVAAALTSFRDGLYFVFLDDRQIESLDAPVAPRPDSEILFLRLVALAGG